MWQVADIDGKSVPYKAEWVSGQLWVYFNGQTFCISDDKRTGNRKSGAKKSADKVIAPMPGKITKVLVSEGSSVKVGDSLVVMEAMKMEYTLKAEGQGIVKAIGATMGQQVTLGTVLVQLSIETDSQESEKKA